MNWAYVQEIVERHRITYAIIAALLIAILLTMVSMALYISSGASRLDLSRPGYERVRSDVGRDSEETMFSSTGPVNTSVADDFQARFDARRATLNKLDTFGSNALEDGELQIAPTTE